MQIRGKTSGIVFWCLAVFWMGFIFFMSAQNGEESAEMSSPIIEFVTGIIYPDFGDMSVSEQEKIENTIGFVVRKGAHFTEYAILGILIYWVVQMYLLNGRVRFIISWLAATLYAVSDEVHQGFVGGRAPQVRDVCIDSSGAFAGVFISTFVIYILVKRRKRLYSKKYNNANVESRLQ